MSDLEVDLTNCDREPIHIPGQIQSHGFLIVVDQECIIRFHSDNIASFVEGLSESLLGKPIHFIERYLRNKRQPEFITELIKNGKENHGFEHTNPFLIDLAGIPYYLIIAPSADYFQLEFEPAISFFDLDIQKSINRSITDILGEKNLLNMLTNTARQVKNIIHFDRVMIYRFSEDGHGEVIAEARNEDLEAWLGLHYPATDIPKQARELYKKNLTRLIANVNTKPAKILTAPENKIPLDLTNSQLRAVSTVHIQYLKNMGVASSFSISILYKNELWGLIACHNYTPRFIDYKSRESSKLLSQILSSTLEFRQDEENQVMHDLFKMRVNIIAKNLQLMPGLEEALSDEQMNLLKVVNAESAVLFYENRTVKFGTTPNDAQLSALLCWISRKVTTHFYQTNRLSSVFPAGAEFQEIASGLLLIVISRELNEYIVWFKPEQKQTILWAGNPDKPAEVGKEGSVLLTPRHSFEAWSQTVSGISESWSSEEIKSVLNLRDELIYSINQKAGAIKLLNEKLREAYEELDTFSYTISHDLKNPIAAIKGYAQILGSDTSIATGKQKLVTRIEERADKMNLMINEVLDYSRIGRSEILYRKVDIGSLAADIVHDLEILYKANPVTIKIGTTPPVKGDPIMLMQVFSNLIGNAFKYARMGTGAVIEIEGWEEASEIIYRISDNGLGIEEKDLPFIFELFTRMSNVQGIEGSGVGLSIVKRIVEKHKGRIWVESKPGEGSVFYLAFNQ